MIVQAHTTEGEKPKQEVQYQQKLYCRTTVGTVQTKTVGSLPFISCTLVNILTCIKGFYVIITLYLVTLLGA